jgi:WD40 repeat protein
VARSLGVARAKVAVAALLLVAATAAAGLAAWPRPRPQPPEAPRLARAPLPAPRALVPVKLGTRNAHPDGVAAVALSPDGQVLATGGYDSRVGLWSVKGLEERALFAPGPLGRPNPVYAVAFSPDGKTLATGGGTYAEVPHVPLPGEVKLWDVETRAAKAILRGRPLHIHAVAFSPDGKSLAAGCGLIPAVFKEIKSFDDIPPQEELDRELGEVTVWDLASGKGRTFFRGQTGRIRAVCFSPDSKALAAGGRDGTIRIWDVASGQERACLQESRHCVNAVCFSPDGKTLASAQDGPRDGVKLWDMSTGRARARFDGHAGVVTSVAFSPDGKLLATTGIVVGAGSLRHGEARLWDAATGRPFGAPLACDHQAASVAFGARGPALILVVAGQAAAGGPLPGGITVWELAR